MPAVLLTAFVAHSKGGSAVTLANLIRTELRAVTVENVVRLTTYVVGLPVVRRTLQYAVQRMCVVILRKYVATGSAATRVRFVVITPV